MGYQTCEDCGSRMYGGFCSMCDEEVFIEEQYEREGESAPNVIAEAAAEQRLRKKYRIEQRAGVPSNCGFKRLDRAE